MRSDTVAYPQRKRLPHEVPAWVPDGSRYFITICCEDRGRNTLACKSIADSLLRSVEVRQELNQWHVLIMMIMPDHLHLIACFNKSDGAEKIIQSLKRFHARQDGIRWQAGFFEHRLRNDAEFTEKYHYVLMNPVRKDLVGNPSDWPYRFYRGQH